MRKQKTAIGILSLLLISCSSPDIAPIEEPIVPDVVIEEVEEIEGIEEELLEEAKEVQELSEAEALALSYAEAVEVRDLVIEVSSEMNPETQEALADAIEAFTADIETLKYFAELADREPLLDEDHRTVAELTASIEEAITLFVNVLELIL